MEQETVVRVPLTKGEWRHTGLVAGVFAMRTFGLFLLLPVLALHAAELPDATPLLVGLAVGGYGLTQALLQVPLGALSDRVGRKPVVAGGLVVFGLGGVVAALAPGIAGIVLGRALQGAGAISGALSASLADHTRDEVRTRAMALLGATMGLSFIGAMVIAPPLAMLIGVRGLFWLSVVLAALALLAVLIALPGGRTGGNAVARSGWLAALRDWRLMRLNLSVFLLHMVLTATFVTLPGVLRDEVLLPVGQHGPLYLGALVLSFAVVIPLVIASDGPRARPELPMVAFGLLAAGQLWLGAGGGTWLAVLLAMTVFFAGFNYLEARLPALLTQTAPAELRGAALGVFGATQFLGAFFGGALSGWIQGQWGAVSVFSAAACAGAVGALLLRQARRPAPVPGG